MKLTLEQAYAMMDGYGNLDLCRSNVTELPDGLCVPGWLDLRYTSIAALPDGLCVGGTIWLQHSSIATLPDNLCVGFSLYINDSPIKELPNGLRIGFWLSFDDIRLPDDIAVGQSVSNCYTPLLSGEAELMGVRHLLEGEYVPGRYLYADGILTHVKAKRNLKNGYTVYIGKIPGRNVVSDGKHYAHCDKLRDGIADLLFKSAEDRGAEQYRGMSLDTALTVDEAVTMYRIITGACRQGSQAFVNSLGKLKESYTVSEILDITKGQYGSDRFKEFFGLQ